MPKNSNNKITSGTYTLKDRSLNDDSTVVIYNIEANKNSPDVGAIELPMSIDQDDCIKYFILDMSACSFIDSDGTKLLNLLFTSLRTLKIELLLAACPRKFFLYLFNLVIPHLKYKTL